MSALDIFEKLILDLTDGEADVSKAKREKYNENPLRYLGERSRDRGTAIIENAKKKKGGDERRFERTRGVRIRNIGERLLNNRYLSQVFKEEAYLKVMDSLDDDRVRQNFREQIEGGMTDASIELSALRLAAEAQGNTVEPEQKSAPSPEDKPIKDEDLGKVNTGTNADIAAGLTGGDGNIAPLGGLTGTEANSEGGEANIASTEPLTEKSVKESTEGGEGGSDDDK